jgi:phosphosulfolactate synthase (CoM biosynthesis protein A)
VLGMAAHPSHDGPEVNLFADHAQIVQLEGLRRGIWGTKSFWRRIVTYPGGERR